MLAAVFIGLSIAITLGSIFAVYRVRSRAPSAPCFEGVSILKPLSGVDPALEANLRTFFALEHPRFELVFGAEDPRDPALAIVEKLAAEHPHVAVHVVRGHARRGLNPKVRNLRAMADAATHDMLVISDSNVAVPSHYLRELASTLAEPGVGLVTSLFAGVGETTLGSRLECLHLSATLPALVALPSELFGHAVAVGKSMAFRRSVFEQLGGFESLAYVLAEDYVLGRMFASAGYAVRLARTPVHNVCGGTTLRTFIARQLRWAAMRARLEPFAFLLEPLTIPAVTTGLATMCGANPIAMFVLGVVLQNVRDASVFVMLRGTKGLGRAMALAPLRDLVVMGVFVAAPFVSRIDWRGHRVRIAAGTHLFLESRPSVPPAA